MNESVSEGQLTFSRYVIVGQSLNMEGWGSVKTGRQISTVVKQNKGEGTNMNQGSYQLYLRNGKMDAETRVISKYRSEV
jgi:predicted porin